MSPQTNNQPQLDPVALPPPTDGDAFPVPSVTEVNQLPVSRRHRRGRLIFLLFCVAIALLVLFNLQNIEDWWKLRLYQPPASVSQLASQDTMTAYGRKLLYLNHPDIADKAYFSTQCLNKDKEQSIVLGCYHSVENGIYLLHVTDPQLNGVEQVTAAHEMLHAAYDRLSSSERKKVDAMLEDYYQHDLKDPRVKGEIALYKQTEPNSVVNEMHSVFGTEIANLPAPLEQYYQRYFTNRATIVKYADQYQAAFTSLQDQVMADDTKLATMKTTIDQLEASLNSQLTVINAQQQILKQKRVTDQAGYNAAVPAYNRLIVTYNSDAKQLTATITSYNNLVNQRNAIAVQEQQLSNDLNANVTPIKN